MRSSWDGMLDETNKPGRHINHPLWLKTLSLRRHGCHSLGTAPTSPSMTGRAIQTGVVLSSNNLWGHGRHYGGEATEAAGKVACLRWLAMVHDWYDDLRTDPSKPSLINPPHEDLTCLSVPDSGSSLHGKAGM